jgi:quercetin dioxygenase-like cupin family protein
MKSTALLDAGSAGTISLAEAGQVVGHGIVSRTLLATPELRSVLFSFAPEQALTEHTSTSRALIHIVSGECEFSVNGAPRGLKAGDILHLPPNVPHAVRATTAMTMLLVLAPPTRAVGTKV